MRELKDVFLLTLSKVLRPAVVAVPLYKDPLVTLGIRGDAGWKVRGQRWRVRHPWRGGVAVPAKIKEKCWT